jgi:hypothetical protein
MVARRSAGDTIRLAVESKPVLRREQLPAGNLTRDHMRFEVRRRSVDRS